MWHENSVIDNFGSPSLLFERSSRTLPLGTACPARIALARVGTPALVSADEKLAVEEEAKRRDFAAAEVANPPTAAARTS